MKVTLHKQGTLNDRNICRVVDNHKPAQKKIITNKCTVCVIIFTVRTSYMFQPLRVIFRENCFFTLWLHLYVPLNSLNYIRAAIV
jgi:hypothetical protein